MTTQKNIKDLYRIVGRDNVRSSNRDLVAYSYDATQRQVMPGLVIFCHNAAEVSGVMTLAYRQHIPVVPRGAGTGISGGTIPVQDCIVLELSRMNKIISIDTANRRAVVEPGVVNLDLQDALAPFGFIYPPDPASQKSCTLGGNVGENAGGPLCFRYGVTSKYVCGMEVVLPSGEVVLLGGSVEDTPGYDLRGLFIGSEGTLGVATKLILQILPAPEAQKTMLAIFDALEDAGRSVAEIIGKGIIPSALELMDRKMCSAIEQSLHAGYPIDAEGVLLIEVAGLADGLDRQAKEISDICQRNKVRQVRFAKNGAEREALWKGRRGAFGSVARICPPYLVNDGTVPRNRIVEALTRVQELPAKYAIQIANVAHAGDGNLHPLIVYDRNKPEEAIAAKKAGEEVLNICLDLGGTISGEHGIGLEKLKAIYRMFSAADLAAMRKVKQVFDPNNIMNPGKLLPPQEEPKDDEQRNRRASETLVDKMAGIVGAGNLITDVKKDTGFIIDNCLPEIVVFPSTSGQISQIVREGNECKKTIVPWGSGSRKKTGSPVSSANIVISLKNLNNIVDLDPGNSTVGVQAGMVISDFQKELAKYNLFLPLDPNNDSSTIGGVIAANDSGPRRFMFGTAKDLVLGLTVVNPTGDIIRFGGKTMKNVAGLDMCKLFIGSWGTLGIVTEAVLRLFTLPEVSKTCLLTFSGVDQAMQLVGLLLNSSLNPAAIELANWNFTDRMKCDYFAPLKRNEFLVAVDIEGTGEVVDRHLKDIGSLARSNARQLTILQKADATKFWELYRSVNQFLQNDVDHGIRGKASVALTKQADMFKAIIEIDNRYGVETSVTSHCGNGIIYAHIAADTEVAVKAAGELNAAAKKFGGFFAIEQAPLQIRMNHSVWNRPDAHNLTEQIRRAFDPGNILDPGKGVAGGS